VSEEASKNVIAPGKLSPWKASWLSSGVVGVLAMAYSIYGVLSRQVATPDGPLVTVVIALFMSAGLTFAISMSLRCGLHLAKCRGLSKSSALVIAVVLCGVFWILGSATTSASLAAEAVAGGVAVIVVPAAIAYRIARTARDT
jgi:hypothetical protein